ncbi:hypothetical protein Athai_03020 [Actinocatenispora thailandica]|uniref:DUF3592 domain-containing protein n=1 Tax=Actinocatenispora thailandica TaxID=227318 RepID=A0A7R7DJF4_9ACTN|nr:hypothetical protein [Actinocatenispora thailandica]BCJ32799.1 hypothetical protein Athai_03020 [Actinocatenispora thailandica]
MARGGPLTPSAAPVRWAWGLVVAGWVLAALGPVLMATVATQLLVATIVGVLLVVAGSVLLSGRIPLFVLSFVVFVPLIAGLVQAGDALVYQASGRTVSCRVTAVTRHQRQVPVHGAPHSPGVLQPTGGTHLETRVSYQHTMRCPAGTYTLARTRPSEVGTRYDVTYDPTGRVPAVFSTAVPALRPFLVVLIALPMVLLLALPLLAWLVGRRRAGARRAADGPPGPPSGPPGWAPAGPAPGPPGWQRPPGRRQQPWRGAGWRRPRH